MVLTKRWNTAERKEYKMSFFVIIVVVPYFIVIAALLRSYWLEPLTREWPWESRRASADARRDFEAPGAGSHPSA